MGVDQVNRIFKHRRIALDANIYIYALNDDPRFRSATTLLKRLAGTNSALCTSAISITEVMVPLFRERMHARIPKYLNFLTGEGRITVVHVDDAIALHAAALRAQYRLKTPDAIHLATAIAFSANVFVTADQDFPIGSVGTLKIEKLRATKTKKAAEL